MSDYIWKYRSFSSVKDTTPDLSALKGGRADGLSLQEIADRHGVDISLIEEQLEMGREVELEHTIYPQVAKRIAMDHLVEIPDYYTRLKKMEAEAGVED